MIRGDGREDLEAVQNVARVLRGGAFNNNPRYLHCASRYWRYPDGLNRLVGFRVVVRP